MVDVLGALREGLAPHYTVEREIGAGGMARVFLAAERHPPRKVAVRPVTGISSGVVMLRSSSGLENRSYLN